MQQNAIYGYAILNAICNNLFYFLLSVGNKFLYNCVVNSKLLLLVYQKKKK